MLLGRTLGGPMSLSMFQRMLRSMYPVTKISTLFYEMNPEFTDHLYCRHWSRHIPGGASFEAEWNAKFAEYEKKYKEEAAELKSIIKGELPAGWETALPVSTNKSLASCMHFF